MTTGRSRSPLKDARLLRKLGKMLGAPGVGLPGILIKVKELQALHPTGAPIERSSTPGFLPRSIVNVPLFSNAADRSCVKAGCLQPLATLQSPLKQAELSEHMEALRGQPCETIPDQESIWNRSGHVQIVDQVMGDTRVALNPDRPACGGLEDRP